jgi:2-methylcitrate dehydratase
MRTRAAATAARGGVAASLAQVLRSYEPSTTSDAVRQTALWLLTDAIGCAAASAAAGEPVVQALRAAIAAAGDSGEASVIGHGRGFAQADAIRLTGALVRAQDLNDAYFGQGAGMVGHPSDNVAPLLIVAGLHDISGRRLLDALILCYEIYCALIDDLDGTREWDHTSVSAVAVPAAVGWMLGHDERTVLHGVALSTSLAQSSAAIRRGPLSAAKSLANGVVSALAVDLLRLAAAGATGPRSILDEPAGVFAALSADGGALRAVASGTPPLATTRVMLKAFACIGTAQGAVSAGVAAHATFAANRAAVTGLRLHLPEGPLIRAQLDDPHRWAPTTKESADHSIPYLLAVALLDGTVSDEQYRDRRWEHDDVREVIGLLRVSIGGRDFGTPQGAVLEIEGEVTPMTFAVIAPAGHPLNPLSDAERRTRFTAQSAGVWSAESAERILTLIHALDEQSSLRPLTSLLAQRDPNALPRTKEL